MSGSEEAERRLLVELLRRLSPSELPVRAPSLDPAYGLLRGAALPRRPRALLFDVYGTLLVSAAGGDPLSALAEGRGEGTAAAAALEAALAASGIAADAGGFAQEVAALIRRSNEGRRSVRANPEVDVVQLLAERYPDVRSGWLRRVAALLEAALNPCAPMPGARALAADLARDGRPAGIVSNAQFYTPLLIEAHLGEEGGLGRFLPELTFFSYELGVAKPDRAAFDRAAEALAARRIPAGEAVYLGNSFENDMRPAHGVGFMTVLFAGDERSFRPGSGPTASEPDSVVASLDEFASLAGLRPS